MFATNYSGDSVASRPGKLSTPSQHVHIPVWSVAFTIVGPEYISMIAAEAKRPRIYIKNAFKTVYWRFGLFFIVGALAVGIVCPYNDRVLVGVNNGTGTGGGTAAASPYVIAMSNLGVTGFPHLVNALLCTSIFSAGNTYFCVSTRSLYGLALEGRAPQLFRKCTKSGVPWVCFLVVLVFPALSFLSVGSGSAVVLNWLVALITAGGIINYICMTGTFLRYWAAVKAQGLDRNTLPYKGWFQPYCAWIAFIFEILTVMFIGYTAFGPWSTDSFFSYYAMVGVDIVLLVAWKVIKETKFVKATEVDLVWERPIVDAYEESFFSEPIGFWTEMLQLVGIGIKSKRDRRRSSVISNKS